MDTGTAGMRVDDAGAEPSTELTVREAAQMRFAALQDAAVDVRPESHMEEQVRQSQALDDRASTTTSEVLARREKRAMLAAGVLPSASGSQFGGSQGDLGGSAISNPWIVIPGEGGTDDSSSVTAVDMGSSHSILPMNAPGSHAGGGGGGGVGGGDSMQQSVTGPASLPPWQFGRDGRHYAIRNVSFDLANVNRATAVLRR